MACPMSVIEERKRSRSHSEEGTRFENALLGLVLLVALTIAVFGIVQWTMRYFDAKAKAEEATEQRIAAEEACR